MLGRDSVRSCPDNKGTRLKVWFASSEYSWAGEQKIAQQRDFWPQPSAASKPGVMQTGEFRTVSTVRAVV